MPQDTAAPPKSTLRVVVPAEHGAWGIVLEPLALGLLVAPSLAGGLLGLAALLAFLARQPLRLAVADRLRGVAGSRARQAGLAAVLLSGGGLVAFGFALRVAPGEFWLPLLWAAPLALLQFHYDARLRGRALLPELLGASAPGALAAAVAWAGGWSASDAWWLWPLISLRAVPSVVYIRARLRLDRGIAAARGPTWLSHAAALGIVAALGIAGRVPALAALPFAVLLARALHGLSGRRARVRPQVLGALEVIYGVTTVLVVALGYALTDLQR